ncbi:hypothetical protein [Streptomyces sp. NPDC001435]|uniref:hypothetical protein n=1 Tax=unclassified Streptomyces TaxID=2593676 RepID=UPI0036761E6D
MAGVPQLPHQAGRQRNGYSVALGSWGSLVPVLIVSGAAQLGDAAIGAARRNLGMLVTAGALGVVHLVSAWWLSTG